MTVPEELPGSLSQRPIRVECYQAVAGSACTAPAARSEACAGTKYLFLMLQRSSWGSRVLRTALQARRDVGSNALVDLRSNVSINLLCFVGEGAFHECGSTLRVRLLEAELSTAMHCDMQAQGGKVPYWGKRPDGCSRRSSDILKCNPFSLQVCQQKPIAPPPSSSRSPKQQLGRPPDTRRPHPVCQADRGGGIVSYIVCD